MKTTWVKAEAKKQSGLREAVRIAREAVEALKTYAADLEKRAEEMERRG
jgi:hypothetical protein